MPANCPVRGSFFDFVDDPWKHPGHEDELGLPRGTQIPGPQLRAHRRGVLFDALLRGGTTTAMTFTTSFPAATEEFFEEATRRGMRVVAGLAGIDRVA
jgi:hypothetical protein